MLEICRLFLVSVFAWKIVAPTPEVKRSIDSDICIPEYRQVVEVVLINMKPELEPCDDFYQFACGNFTESVPIPKGSQYSDAYTDVSDLLIKQKVAMITNERPELDPKHFKFPYKLFNSCKNITLINSLVDLPVRQIANSLGGWPVVVGDSWDSDNSWSWQDLAKQLRRLGFSTDYIMTFSVGNDLKDETRNILNLNTPTLFESDFYDTSLIRYLNFMVNAAVTFGAKRAAAIRELPKLLSFEKDLAYISKPDSNVHYVSNLVTIKQLQERYPYIEWLDLINALLPEGLTVDENELINLLSPSFFDKLGDLLARTDKRTIANYIMWKFHYFSMKFLSQGFRSHRNQFDSFVLRARPQQSVLRECVLIALESLPISLSSLYIHKHFTQSSKSSVTEIFENIRYAFHQTLGEADWLDNKTKAEARKKLHSMKAIIGFPDEMFDVERMEEYHRELEIDEDKYFETYLKIKTFDLDKRLHELRMSLNETEWVRYTIKGMEGFAYELEANRLYIPGSFLQGQYFSIQRPNYINYGSIGSVIAHEIIHGFCGDGCKYCSDGEKREWWHPASMKALCERQKCLVEQYNNFTDKQTGLKIKGSQTLVENIADNSGAKASYLAYKQWRATHDEELQLPGLKYTPQQMFWISFAQNYCGKFTSDEIINRIQTDTHSPHEFRVLGVLSNMKDFSSDFQCPKNSPMNPEQKCEVW